MNRSQQNNGPATFNRDRYKGLDDTSEGNGKFQYEKHVGERAGTARKSKLDL